VAYDWRVASLRQLVDSPTLAPLLAYLARPRADPLVEGVALIEDLDDLASVPEHSIVLLTHGASAAAGTYRFDVALRLARNRRIAALVLPAGAAATITPTSAAIADRSGTAVLATGPDVDLAELAVAISRELGGGAEVALRRAHSAVRTIAAHPPDGRPEVLVRRVGAVLGIPLQLVAAEPSSGPYIAVAVDGEVEQWIAAAPREGDLAIGLEIVLHATAAAVSSTLARARRAEELPIQSREEVLTEILSAPSSRRTGLVQRARTLEIPIDGWHVAARIEFDELADAPAADETAVYEARLRFARAALQAARASGGTWHSARAGRALVLVRMDRDDPGVRTAATTARTIDEVLARVRPLLPSTLIRCGVGSAHAGPSGLVASAAEARVAVTAHQMGGTVGAAVPFDSVGLRRTLIEWYASDTAQEAVTTVLAPLYARGPARAERLIETLHVYLDQRGSLTRTAEVLSLHRNAVGYRINQIFSLLDVDPENPDDRLLLQLACRARELGMRPPA
jgi:sugar diacid utilization regulator